MPYMTKAQAVTGGAFGASTLPKHGLYPLLTPMRPLTRGDRPTNLRQAKAMEQVTRTILLRLWVDLEEKNA